MCNGPESAGDVIRSFVHRANRLAKTLQIARKLSHVFSRSALSRARRYSLLGLAVILVGPFRQCGQKRGMGQGSASHLIDPGSAAATPLTRVPFHLNGSLTISCGANDQEVAALGRRSSARLTARSKPKGLAAPRASSSSLGMTGPSRSASSPGSRRSPAAQCSRDIGKTPHTPHLFRLGVGCRNHLVVCYRCIRRHGGLLSRRPSLPRG